MVVPGPEGRPEAIVAWYFECIREEDYLGATSLLTERVLERFREFEAHRHRPPSSPTVEHYLERNPELPRAVAEYWVSQRKGRPSPTLSDYFARVDSEGELQALSDLEVYARHVEAMDHAARFRRMLDALRARYPEHDDEIREVRDRQRSTWDFEILGSVETRRRAYVLFGREPSEEDEAVMHFEATPHVAVLRSTVNGWRLAANPNPYSGMGVGFAPIPVTGKDGERIMLDPYEAWERP